MSVEGRQSAMRRVNVLLGHINPCCSLNEDKSLINVCTFFHDTHPSADVTSKWFYKVKIIYKLIMHVLM